MQLMMAIFPLIFLQSGGESGTPFRRGDVNNSYGVNLIDPISIIQYLFIAETSSLQCPDAADANDDGGIDVSDIAYLLGYLFIQGPEPPEPFPEPDLDPTEDSLGCEFYRGDFFGFVIDRSGSMAAGGGLTKAKTEVVKNINQLSPAARFAIVFFDKGLLAYPQGDEPAFSIPRMKTEAIDFLQATPGGSGSCVKDGLLKALDFASHSNSHLKVVIFLTDGGSDCPGYDPAAYAEATVVEVTEKNVDGVRINVIVIGTESNLDWLMKLVSQNGGMFTRIP